MNTLTLMYSTCIRLTVLCLGVHNNSETVQGHSRLGFSCGLGGSYSSWIRCLGVVLAWPNLWGCTGDMLGVTDTGTGTGVTSETAGVCGFVVAGVAGATGRGCSSCAGLVGADDHAEMCGLAGACSVTGVTAGVVSVGLTLHSQWCHIVQQ